MKCTNGCNQPRGQRVEDHVEYAVDVLRRYAPERLVGDDAEDEWTPTLEPITNEQVQSLLTLLALPYREVDFNYFAEDED